MRVKGNQQISSHSGAGPTDPIYDNILRNRAAFDRIIHLYGDSLFRGYALNRFPDTLSPEEAAAEPLWELRSPAAMLNLLFEGEGMKIRRGSDGTVTGGDLVAAYAGNTGQPDAARVEKAAASIRSNIAANIIRKGDVVAFIDAGAHNGDPDQYETNWLVLRGVAHEAAVTVVMFDMFDYINATEINGKSADMYRYDIPFRGSTGITRSHNAATRVAATSFRGEGSCVLVPLREAMDRFLAYMQETYGVSVMRRDGIHPNVWGQWQIAATIAEAAVGEGTHLPGEALCETVKRHWHRLGYGTRSEAWTEAAALDVLTRCIGGAWSAPLVFNSTGLWQFAAPNDLARNVVTEDIRDGEILIQMAGGPDWIGGVQYTRNLVRALGLLPADEQPRVVLNIGPRNAGMGFEEEFGRYPHVVVDGPIDDSGEPSKIQRILRRLLGGGNRHPRRSDDCSIVYPVKGPDFVSDALKVLWIPDFQYKVLPEFYTDEDRHDRDRMYGRMFEMNTFIVFSSHTVERHFQTFFPGPHRVRARVVNFHSVFENDDYAPDPAETCRAYGLPDRFVYLPNQFYRHKGHDAAFRALAKMKNEGLALPLVCTGAVHDYRTTEHFAPLLNILDEAGIAGQVRILELVPRRDQVQFYRQASVVLQPSLSEGWSTTAEDARALGKDIVLSDLDVHQEQAPEHGTLFRVGDVDDLAAKLGTAWTAAAGGHQPKRERQARDRAEENGLRFARSFMAVMAEAHALARARHAGDEGTQRVASQSR